MYPRLVFLATILLLLTACNEEARQAQGFSLPEGEIESGKVAFTELGCQGCHTIEGIEQGEDPEMSIRLGGEPKRTKTYGELVTAVINPTHRTSRAWMSSERREAGQSVMQSYNEVMTVQELVDIVTFLQSEYTLPPHSRTRYIDYYQAKKQEN